MGGYHTEVDVFVQGGESVGAVLAAVLKSKPRLVNARACLTGSEITSWFVSFNFNDLVQLEHTLPTEEGSLLAIYDSFLEKLFEDEDDWYTGFVDFEEKKQEVRRLFCLSQRVGLVGYSFHRGDNGFIDEWFMGFGSDAPKVMYNGRGDNRPEYSAWQAAIDHVGGCGAAPIRPDNPLHLVLPAFGEPQRLATFEQYAQHEIERGRTASVAKEIGMERLLCVGRDLIRAGNTAIEDHFAMVHVGEPTVLDLLRSRFPQVQPRRWWEFWKAGG